MTDAVVLRPADESALEHALPHIRAFAVRISEFAKSADPAAGIRTALSPALADRVLTEFKLQPEMSKGRIRVFARDLGSIKTSQ